MYLKLMKPYDACSYSKYLKYCNLIGLQIFCSGTNPGIAMSPNLLFFVEVGPRPTIVPVGQSNACPNFFDQPAMLPLPGTDLYNQLLISV